MKDPFSSISVRSDAAYFLKATLVGILVGGLATGFHTGLDFLFAHYAALRQALGPGYMPYVVSMAISAACVTGAYILVKRVAPEAAGSGIQEIEGAMEDKRPLHWPRVLIAKFFGGLLALGSGLVLGREGPTIHMGAMTTRAFWRPARQPDLRLRSTPRLRPSCSSLRKPAASFPSAIAPIWPSSSHRS